VAIGAPGSYALQIAEAEKNFGFLPNLWGLKVVPNSSVFFLAKKNTVAI